MTFGQYLSILRARWWVVALVLGLTVATTLVVSLLLPKKYSATASDVLLQRFTQTSLESQTTQSSVNVLTQATPPLEHSTPNLQFNTLLSVFLGSLLALGTALLLELMDRPDRRVRSPDDVVEALPVLGLMPKPGASLRLGGARISPMQQRLMAPLLQPTQGA